MLDDPKVLLCKGLASCAIIWGTWFAINVVPIISVLGTLAGSFVAFYGLYRIIKDWLYRKHNQL